MTDETTQKDVSQTTPDEQPQTEAATAKKKKTDAQRKKEYEANRQAMDELCELYPQAFNPRQPKPLQIGIHEALAADSKLSKTRIRRALNVYVRLRSYYACMVEGADRVTIDGSATGTVSAEDASHAKEKFDAIEKRRAERTAKARPKKPARSKNSSSKHDSAKNSSTKNSPAKNHPTKNRAAKNDSAENKEERLQRKLEALVNKPKND